MRKHTKENVSSLLESVAETIAMGRPRKLPGKLRAAIDANGYVSLPQAFLDIQKWRGYSWWERKLAQDLFLTEYFQHELDLEPPSVQPWKCDMPLSLSGLLIRGIDNMTMDTRELERIARRASKHRTGGK